MFVFHVLLLFLFPFTVTHAYRHCERASAHAYALTHIRTHRSLYMSLAIFDEWYCTYIFTFCTVALAMLVFSPIFTSIFALFFLFYAMPTNALIRSIVWLSVYHFQVLVNRFLFSFKFNFSFIQKLRYHTYKPLRRISRMSHRKFIFWIIFNNTMVIHFFLSFFHYLLVCSLCWFLFVCFQLRTNSTCNMKIKSD